MVRVVAFQYGKIKLWRADDIHIMAVRRLRRRRSCAVLPASNAGAAGAAPGPRERVLLWLRTTRTALLTRRRGGWDVFPKTLRTLRFGSSYRTLSTSSASLTTRT
jgi:hypothetical protein